MTTKKKKEEVEIPEAVLSAADLFLIEKNKRLAALKADVFAMLEKRDSIKKIRGYLAFQDLSDKEAAILLKECGIDGNTRAGFTYPDTLAMIERGVSEYEFYETLIREKARNECRYAADRNRIRILVNSIRANFGEAIEEKPATDTQRERAKLIIKGE